MIDIHNTAIIEEGAIIEDGVKIGPYCIIGKDVKIGKNTTIQSHVVIEGITEIGENNTIREFVTIHRGTDDRWETRIGNGNLIMAYVHVAHDVIIGDGCIFSNNATLAGHVVVDSYAIVGGLTPIHQFCRIGSYSMTGGASAVNQDICPFILAEGNKAIPRGLNSVGLRRRGFTDEEISRLKKAYKIVFRSGLPLKDALAQIEAEIEQDKNITYFVDFIKNSNRGIAR